ncbi:chitinase [Colletotrichum truncatum]|uniref:Chitinase n=1 Tax=Colletotrichum truncatum TaxID=5467 RepID=A0ACC3YV01_COLTU|nr:chitinase [Colletotrichum truncatum]KAF6785876.1 chitinase [Colletotrichum truncatum]
MWAHVLSAGLGLLYLTNPGSAQQEASPVNPCPVRCSVSGPNPLNWTYFHGVLALNRCEEPMLFKTMLGTSLEDPNKHVTFRACTASEKSTVQAMDYEPVPFTFGGPGKRSVDKDESGCASDMQKTPNMTSISYHEWLTDSDAGISGSIADTTLALDTLKSYLDKEESCKRTAVFAKVRYAIAGLFVGSAVDKPTTVPVVEQLISSVKDKENYEAGRIAVQNCKGNGPSAWSVGIIADLQGNITSVQNALFNWNDAKCLQGSDMSADWREMQVNLWSVKSTNSSDMYPPRNSTGLPRNSTAQPALADRHVNSLHRRAECRAERVESGDTCISMADRCGISLTQFYKYNTGTNFCNLLKPKQHVCCSSGDLPDFRPQPDADGNCHAIDIEEEDGCWDIADAHYLTVKDIEELNKNTWGFAGCGDLQPGQKICLSKGEPPMPNPISNAICGPQKLNGEPRGNKKLEDMNPCPLNVCCNVWGQCGLDNDFCVKNPADNGAPGTSKPGKNGCIANCGMNITNNDKGPDSFSHIAYFEAWNKNRACLHMDVTDIDTNKYTHIHFAFPNVTAGDFNIDVGTLKDQFDKMKKMTGIKRIVSLGGWAFSAEAPTYTIFREAVMPDNRAKFAANVVKFVNDHELDGIDFDWEYPAAEDLPGIPSANPLEGQDYLEFLKLVKRRLPNKSVSIAAPASYWYLRGFHIKDIATVVDYIVYMSYDLHGQWDHGNKWSSPGCENGDCLRSHINITETMTALAMITKAGVPSYKVFVGIASYGRSFKMSEAGCTGPECTYTGTREESDAMKGPCTDTAGYISSAEIREILWNGDLLGAKQWHDDDSDSDIVVYKETEWVAWMNDDTKASRIDKYKGLNFGGVSDWAVDLDKDYGDSDIGGGGDDDTNLSGGKNCPLSKRYNDLEELANDGDVSDDCKPVLAMNVLENMLDSSLASYEDVDNGYDKNFAAYRRVMKESAKEAMWKFSKWRDGKYTEWFDCDFKDLDDSGRNWKGPCDQMKDHVDAWLKGVMTVKVTLRDEDGFWKGLEEETGIIQDWVEFGDFKQNTEPGAGCNPPPPPPQVCTIQYILSVEGIPVLKDDFEIPDPKDIIKDIQGNMDEIRTGIASRFFDVVAGIWEGGNGDVVQVLSVPIFLLAQAVDSMEEAKKKGGEIIQQEREALILGIISALLFFIPFVGEFAAMAAGAATVGRMIALAGLLGNTAFTIHDIVGNPENAAMAIMALLSGGRVRKPKDFVDLGAARRAQTNSGIKRMGPTFKKHDDSLQKVLGNCRKDGGNDDDEPNMCKNKRGLFRRAANNCPNADVHETVTTKVETFMTTPDVTCSETWSQACYHYSSVMSVHSNTPDMVRWTCWKTASSTSGKATNDWGSFGSQKRKLPKTAQHHWDWAVEWTEEARCDRDEWPPRNFWPKAKRMQPGQIIRLLPADQNESAGTMWRQFCATYDEYKTKTNGKTEVRDGARTTTDKKVEKKVDKGTTTYITSVGVKVPNAVFEIKHWDHTKITSLRDDGLWDNPCWPSALLPNDPGFVLLTDDPWYGNNANAQVSTDEYNSAPPSALTSGMTKSRALPGRPIIAVRSVGDLYEESDTFYKEIAVEERATFIDENGVEYEEILTSDDLDWSETDWSELDFAPALSLPLTAEAVPSATVVLDYIEKEEEAKPGSVVVDGLAKPTNGLS